MTRLGHCAICSPLDRIATITTLQRNHWRRHNPPDTHALCFQSVPTGDSGVPTGSATPLFLSTNVLGLYASVTLSGTVEGATATQLDHYDQRNKQLTPSGQRRDGICDDVTTLRSAVDGVEFAVGSATTSSKNGRRRPTQRHQRLRGCDSTGAIEGSTVRQRRRSAVAVKHRFW